MRRHAVLIPTILVALATSPSWADTGPYEDAGTNTVAEPSDTGTAHADADADLAGNLSVEAAAAEDFVLPVALVGGRSEATAAAGIADILEVTGPGDFVVTATLSDTVTSADASDPALGPIPFTTAEAMLEASMFAMLFDCTGQGCTNVLEPGTEGRRVVALDCSNGCPGADSTVVLEIPITVPEGVTGHVFVTVDLTAEVVARGQSQAAGSASTVVSSVALVASS